MIDKIELNNLNFEHRESVVYYSSPELLIQKARPYIHIERGSEAHLLKNPVFQELNSVKAVKYNNGVVLTFGGREGLIVTDDFEYFELDQNHIVTDLYVHEDRLIFGSILGKFFHFVSFDLKTKKKVSQSQSSQVDTLSVIKNKEKIYTLMSNSQIMCYDIECKLLWKKFEHQYVVPGLAFYKDKLIYCASNQIKLTNGKDTESINVPIITIDKIEGVVGHYLYGVCGARRNLFCFDLLNKKLYYEVKIDDIIKKLLITRGKLPESEKIIDALFFSTKTHLGLVNLKNGNIQFLIQIPQITSIQANEEIIVKTHLGESHLLRVIENEHDTIIEI